MILAALILAATVASIPPAPVAPTATPVSVAGTGRTRTLGDVARERRLGIKGVGGGTLSVAGAPVDTAFGQTPGALDLSISGLGRRTDAPRNWKVAPPTQDAPGTHAGLPSWMWKVTP